MSEPLRPDEVIDPGAATPASRSWMLEAALALPNLVKLLYRLMRDPRVPRRSKILIGLTLGYVATPIDLLPDFLPVIGQTDDVLLMAYAVHHLIHVAGEQVVLDHWDGSQDVLAFISATIEAGARLLPRPVQRLLKRWGTE